MLQTVEVEVDVNGTVRLLEPLQIRKTTRAVLTLLPDSTDSAPVEPALLEGIGARMKANSFAGNPPRFTREELHERR